MESLMDRAFYIQRVQGRVLKLKNPVGTLGDVIIMGDDQ
ncbi:hypothetical protein GKJPGBOP_02868 [Streptomyces paromomycinus]|uniref:Uncharacterized protein n=1 Tax=Streptomyces paromomycinus TaxID=92743 RepID=A0A401W1G8_STREY|nr:hypothetical protein GKJPGBOP_02868 [Streptomyces paromomycinus]